jgi:hypothetical protein
MGRTGSPIPSAPGDAGAAAPPRFDPDTIRCGLNFALVTATGGGAYEALLSRSEPRARFGLAVRFVDLETLIPLKRAAGRPKDLERSAELEAISEERRKA